MKLIITKVLASFLICFWVLIFIGCTTSQSIHTDVLIVGGGTSGVAAGLQSARMGVSTIIVEESPWLGGMLTSAGVSAVDGNYNLLSGIWGEFVDSLVVHYGGLDSLKTGWVSNIQFEPSVGNEILQRMTKNEKDLNILFNTNLVRLNYENGVWEAVVRRGEVLETIYAKRLIDATELGDVAKLAGVSYNIGMDAKALTGESIAPEEGNNIIQDLTYVAVLKDYGRDVSIEKPEGYDASVFACSHKNAGCADAKEPNRLWDADMMITYGKLPNNKYMINWPIEGNDYYVNAIEMSASDRKAAFDKAKHFTACFIYYIQNEMGYNNLGLADDEFPTADLFPFIPYHRESRRIDGEVLFTINDITHPYSQKDNLYRTTIAVGDYPVDHHHTRYEDYQALPDLHFYPVPSYGLPLGVLIPKNVDDLIVAEKSISVTNLVNGTTRLQPVVLQIGQASGALAALSVINQTKIKDVNIRELQDVLLQSGMYLLPYLDVAKDDAHFAAYQRTGATGILQGVGKNVDWSNQTWLRVNDPLLASELGGLLEFYPNISLPTKTTALTKQDVQKILADIVEQYDLDSSIVAMFNESNKENAETIISRGQFAVAIDSLLNPFFSKNVDLKGNWIE